MAVDFYSNLAPEGVYIGDPVTVHRPDGHVVTSWAFLPSEVRNARARALLLEFVGAGQGVMVCEGLTARGCGRYWVCDPFSAERSTVCPPCRKAAARG